MRMTELYAIGAKTEIGPYTFDEDTIIRSSSLPSHHTT